MGVWALRLAPGAVPVAWCCAVMCDSRRGLCGPVSAVMSLELDGAILHISSAPGEVGFRGCLWLSGSWCCTSMSVGGCPAVAGGSDGIA